MKKKLYEQGYYVFVNSWENDGDNVNETSLPMKNKQEAYLYKDIALLFTNDGKCLGNIVEGNSFAEVDEELTLIAEKYPEIFSDVDLADQHYTMYDMISDMGLSSEYFQSRVTQSVEIIYFKNPVYGEIID